MDTKFLADALAAGISTVYIAHPIRTGRESHPCEIRPSDRLMAARRAFTEKGGRPLAQTAYRRAA